MKRAYALLALAGTTAGCDNAPRADTPPRATPTHAAAPVRQDWAAGGCEGRPDQLPAAEGRSDAELAAQFGPPTSLERFLFGRSVGEFRIRLRNTLHMPEDAEVVVTERTWSAGKCRLTVWSISKNGTGAAIDNLVWSSDVQF